MKQIIKFNPTNSIDEWHDLINDISKEELDMTYAELYNKYHESIGDFMPTDIQNMGIYSVISELKNTDVKKVHKLLYLISKLDINYLTFLPSTIDNFFTARTISQDTDRFYTDGLFQSNKDPMYNDFFIKQIINAHYVIIINSKIKRKDIVINKFRISRVTLPSKKELLGTPMYKKTSKNQDFYKMVRKRY